MIGESVRGSKHTRLGVENQDAIAWLPDEGSGPAVVLAVADGHGARRHFRAAVGARLAANVGCRLTAEMLREGAVLVGASDLAELARGLVVAWQEHVAHHLAEHPLTAKELTGLGEEGDSSDRKEVEATPALAYGSTVLVVGAREDQLVLLQLGDGDIVLVDADATVSRPLPPDELLVADETTSLVGEASWENVRSAVVPVGKSGPLLAMASTDGYSNSFQEDPGFLQAASDLFETLKTEGGHEEVRLHLASWLEETSAQGSGDDITVGFLVRDPRPRRRHLAGGIGWLRPKAARRSGG